MFQSLLKRMDIGNLKKCFKMFTLELSTKVRQDGTLLKF